MKEHPFGRFFRQQPETLFERNLLQEIIRGRVTPHTFLPAYEGPAPGTSIHPLPVHFHSVWHLAEGWAYYRLAAAVPRDEPFTAPPANGVDCRVCVCRTDRGEVAIGYEIEAWGRRVVGILGADDPRLLISDFLARVGL